MVQNNLDSKSLVERAQDLSFPSSVVEFMQGKIGQPPYGFPEPLRSKILRGKPTVDGRPGQDLTPVDFDKLRSDLEHKHGRTLRCDFKHTLSTVMCAGQDLCGVKSSTFREPEHQSPKNFLFLLIFATFRLWDISYGLPKIPGLLYILLLKFTVVSYMVIQNIV